MFDTTTYLIYRQVKPGLPYLDIVRLLRDNSALPIAAYQVKCILKSLNSWLFTKKTAIVFMIIILVKSSPVSYAEMWVSSGSGFW